MKHLRNFAPSTFFVFAVGLLLSTPLFAQISESGAPVRIAKHHLVSYTCPVADLKANVQAAGGDIDRIWTSIGIARVRGLDPSAASLIQYPGITAAALDIDVARAAPA